jgi:hypothetical protein
VIIDRVAPGEITVANAAGRTGRGGGGVHREIAGGLAARQARAFIQIR